MRRRLILLASLFSLLVLACGGADDDSGGASPTAVPTKIGGSMILATTTSTVDTGLLEYLLPVFKEQTGIDVKAIAQGTGAALKTAAAGDADAVLVHAPSSEKPYVESGDLVNGKLVMHNDYVLVGPASDPGQVKGLKDINAAMAAIAAAGPFISRGDASGTNTKELELWKTAGIDPKAVKSREETGQGMGATLNVADQKQAYTLTDRGSYLALRKNLKLEVVFAGAPSLLNIYHVYAVSQVKHPNVKIAQANAFVAFMVDPATQVLIGNFRKAEYGESLFIADAGKREEDIGK